MKLPTGFFPPMRSRLRVKHYSIRTEQAYVNWIKRFIWFHGKRHPKDIGARELEAFLTHLAVEGSLVATDSDRVAILTVSRGLLHEICE